MLSFEVSLNVLWLPLIALLFAIIGFLLRSSQLKKSRDRVLSLENEMLQNHSDILDLNKEVAALKNMLGDSKTPVVSIKDSEEKPALKERK